MADISALCNGHRQTPLEGAGRQNTSESASPGHGIHPYCFRAVLILPKELESTLPSVRRRVVSRRWKSRPEDQELTVRSRFMLSLLMCRLPRRSSKSGNDKHTEDEDAGAKSSNVALNGLCAQLCGSTARQHYKEHFRGGSQMIARAAEALAVGGGIQVAGVRSSGRSVRPLQPRRRRRMLADRGPPHDIYPPYESP